jgi:hypothetical protein
MSNQKSMVLVLGAGASFEVGLPVGSTLKERIVNTLANLRVDDYQTHSPASKRVRAAMELLSRNSGDLNTQLFSKLFEAAQQIGNALELAISIDNYIHQNRHDEGIAICGKLAIAACILEAEAGSKLRTDGYGKVADLRASSITCTWYHEFYQRLVEGCSWEDLPERLNQMAIVSFNYDRTVEHYLQAAICILFNKETPAVAALLNEYLTIIHPYGTVGKLPWQDSSQGVAFGSRNGIHDLVRVSTSLRTFTEGIDPESSQINEIRSIVRSAKRLVFLGFSFHPLNLKLLIGDSSLPRRSLPIYGTGKGISLGDLRVLAEELSPLGILEDLGYMPTSTCYEFFQSYQRRLSFL